MTTNSPKFLYFDLGNVLFCFDHEIACRQMAEVAGVTVDTVRQVAFESGLEWRYERGEISSREFYELFCDQTESRSDFEELLHAASAIFDLNKRIVPLVAHLKSAGYRLGILSNTCDAHWNYISDGRYPFVKQYFNPLALSFEIGSMKPESAIYTAAAELADVSPNEIFFVDDREENVAAATDAGFDAVQYTSVHALARALRDRGLRFNY